MSTLTFKSVEELDVTTQHDFDAMTSVLQLESYTDGVLVFARALDGWPVKAAKLVVSVMVVDGGKVLVTRRQPLERSASQLYCKFDRWIDVTPSQVSSYIPAAAELVQFGKLPDGRFLLETVEYGTFLSQEKPALKLTANGAKATAKEHQCLRLVHPRQAYSMQWYADLLMAAASLPAGTEYVENLQVVGGRAIVDCSHEFAPLYRGEFDSQIEIGRLRLKLEV